jgi:hypothetical protein
MLKSAYLSLKCRLRLSSSLVLWCSALSHHLPCATANLVLMNIFLKFGYLSLGHHQHLYKSLFGTCTMLCNVVQPLKGKKLQTQPAMSKF